MRKESVVPKDAGGGGSVGMLGYAGKLWSGAQQVARGAGINTYSPGLHEAQSTVRETYSGVTSQLKSSQAARKELATALKLEADYTREATKAVGEYNEAKARGDKDLGQYLARVNKFNDALSDQRAAIEKNTAALASMKKGMTGSVVGAAAAGATIAALAAGLKGLNIGYSLSAEMLSRYNDQLGYYADAGVKARASQAALAGGVGAFRAEMFKLGVSTDEATGLLTKMQAAVAYTKVPYLESGKAAQGLAKDLSAVATVLHLDLTSAFTEAEKNQKQFGNNLDSTAKTLFKLHTGVLAYNLTTKAGKLDAGAMARGVLELSNQTSGYTLNVKRLTDYYVGLTAQAREAGMTQKAAMNIGAVSGSYISGAGGYKASPLVSFEGGKAIETELKSRIGVGDNRLKGKALSAELLKFAKETTGDDEDGSDANKQALLALRAYVAQEGQGKVPYVRQQKLYAALGQHESAAGARADVLLKHMSGSGDYKTAAAATDLQEDDTRQISDLLAVGEFKLDRAGVMAAMKKVREKKKGQLPGSIGALSGNGQANLKNITQHGIKTGAMEFIEGGKGLITDAANSSPVAGGVAELLEWVGNNTGAALGIGGGAAALGGGAMLIKKLRGGKAAATAAAQAGELTNGFPRGILGESASGAASAAGKAGGSALGRFAGGALKLGGRLASPLALGYELVDSLSNFANIGTEAPLQGSIMGADIGKLADSLMGASGDSTVTALGQGGRKLTTHAAGYTSMRNLLPKAMQDSLGFTGTIQADIEKIGKASEIQQKLDSINLADPSDREKFVDLFGGSPEASKLMQVFTDGQAVLQRYSDLPKAVDGLVAEISKSMVASTDGTTKERRAQIEDARTRIGTMDMDPGQKQLLDMALTKASGEVAAAHDYERMFWKNDMPGLVREALIEPLLRALPAGASVVGSVLPGGRLPAASTASPAPGTNVSGISTNGDNVVTLNAGDARNPVYLQISLGTNKVDGVTQTASFP